MKPKNGCDVVGRNFSTAQSKVSTKMVRFFHKSCGERLVGKPFFESYLQKEGFVTKMVKFLVFFGDMGW